MRPIPYLLAIVTLLSPLSLSHAETQQAGINARGVVESAEISGIDEDEISPDIRDAVRKLVGQPFDQATADELVGRITAEKQGFSASTRLLAGDKSDGVKVVFLVEKTDPAAGNEPNVNSRYMVERVEVQGYDESRLSQAIRDEMKALVGLKLDEDKAADIQQRLEDELRPRNYVLKRVVKGSDRQHIVVVYDVRKIRLIPFAAQPPQRLLYHSKQNFSGVVNAPIPLGGDSRLYFGLADDQDELLERFAGFNLGFEATRVGSDHLGLALRYSRYHDRWQPSTVSAAQNAIYRERNGFDPSITVALDSRVRLTAGVSLSDLQIQYPTTYRANANAVTGQFDFQNTWGKRDADNHLLQASYDFRSGNHTLDSDFIYARHLVRARYLYTHNKNGLMFEFLAGRISGNAPLFERFSLGNTSTLRGWNKFDVAPSGGNRVIHGTVQYGFAQNGRARLNFPNSHVDSALGFSVFYDVGAVGDHGSPIKTRHSIGLGYGFGNFSNFLAGIAFPIRSSHVEPVLFLGFRF